MEWLRQTVKDKDNDPRDAIKPLEQKLNQLAITLCPSTESIGEVLNKYTDTLCNAQKKNISRELIITRYSHIEWKRLLTIGGLADRH